MKLRPTLLALARAVADECDRNAPFRKVIEEALGAGRSSKRQQKVPIQRPHRRAPAVLDPVELAELGRDHLRNALAPLDIERLKDIVAQFAMDPSKLVMKWKDQDRIAEHIVETSMTRAAKGNAFRG
jgi:hypothetical protein